MIDRLVIFGGSGDLAGRYLLPALAALQAGGRLSERFELAGARLANRVLDRADEAEEAWRVLTPVLDGWARELVPLAEYEAGSSGPS